jgi:hypothetical protein
MLRHHVLLLAHSRGWRPWHIFLQADDMVNDAMQASYLHAGHWQRCNTSVEQRCLSEGHPGPSRLFRLPVTGLYRGGEPPVSASGYRSLRCNSAPRLPAVTSRRLIEGVVHRPGRRGLTRPRSASCPGLLEISPEVRRSRSRRKCLTPRASRWRGNPRGASWLPRWPRAVCRAREPQCWRRR